MATFFFFKVEGSSVYPEREIDYYPLAAVAVLVLLSVESR